MIINPDKKGYVWDNHPEIKRRSDLCSIPEVEFAILDKKKYIPTLDDLNKLVIFVAYFIDPGSPFYKENVLAERIKACKEAAGIDDSDWLAECIHSRHWWFCGVLASYMKMFADHKMQTWIALVFDAAERKEYLVRPIDYTGDDVEKSISARGNIQKMLPALDEQIESVERQLFPNAFAREAVTMSVTADGIGSWAENFAAKKIS